MYTNNTVNPQTQNQVNKHNNQQQVSQQPNPTSPKQTINSNGKRLTRAIYSTNIIANSKTLTCTKSATQNTKTQ